MFVLNVWFVVMSNCDCHLLRLATNACMCQMLMCCYVIVIVICCDRRCFIELGVVDGWFVLEQTVVC